MKTILTTKNKYVLVDNENFDKLSKFKWYFSNGYASRHQTKTEYRNAIRKSVLMHREILELKKGEITDHINRNKLDNRKCNLRKCTTQQNIFNRRKLGVKTTSKYKGVMLRPYKRWEANIKYNGKANYLGVFNTAKQAALAYNLKAQELFGQFALLNKV